MQITPIVLGWLLSSALLIAAQRARWDWEAAELPVNGVIIGF